MTMALALTSGACGGGGSPPMLDMGSPMLDTGLRPDTTPPSVAFTFPALSGFTQNGTFTFRGVAADDVALASVEVDGQSVTSSDGFATWSITVDTADGGGVFEVVATDTSGNEARATRSIVLHNDLANPRGFHFDPISDDLHYIDGGSLRIAVANLSELTVTPGADVSVFGTGMRAVQGAALDDAGRVLVGAREPGSLGSRGIYALDPATQTWSPLSTAATHPAAPLIEDPIHLTLDRARDRLYVIDAAGPAIVVVDTTTGDRQVLSASTVPNALTAFVAPQAAQLSADGDTLYVTDQTLGLVAVDTSTGGRALISGVGQGQGDALVGVTALAVDEVGARAFVFDRANTAAGFPIVAIDLVTGDRSVFSANPPDNNLSMYFASALFHDGTNERLVASDLARGLLSVSTFDQRRTRHMGGEFPRGDTPRFVTDAVFVGDSVVSVMPEGILTFSPTERTFTPHSEQLMVVEPIPGERAVIAADQTLAGRLYRVDLDTDAVTLIAEGADLYQPQGLVYDADANAVHVLTRAALLTVDVATGGRVVRSSASVPDGTNAFTNAIGLVHDRERARFLVGSYGYDALIAIDEDSGARTLVSPRDMSGGPQSVLSGPALWRGRLFALDNLRDVIELDLETGMRSVAFEQVSGRDARYLHAHEDRLLVVDYRGFLFELDPVTGERAGIHR